MSSSAHATVGYQNPFHRLSLLRLPGESPREEFVGHSSSNAYARKISDRHTQAQISISKGEHLPKSDDQGVSQLR